MPISDKGTIAQRSEAKKTQGKYEIVCALVKALENYAEFCDIIAHANSEDEAIGMLMQRFEVTRAGAYACVEMRFRRLFGEERQKLYDDRDKLSAIVNANR